MLQPRLDGTGGRYWGEAGPEGFALLDAATDPGRVGTSTRDGFTDTPDPDRAATQRTKVAAARAETLYHRLRTVTGARRRPAARPVGCSRRRCSAGSSSRRSSVTTACPPSCSPPSRAAGCTSPPRPPKRIADRYGADLRLVLLDDGHVVGVGRRQYRPPGWLRDATLALHDVCTEPGCLAAARNCDTDHATPYSDPAGRTDVDQLAPLCPTANHTKERDGWTADQTPTAPAPGTTGSVGLTIRTLPAMWRPPPSAGPPDGTGTTTATVDPVRPRHLPPTDHPAHARTPTRPTHPATTASRSDRTTTGRPPRRRRHARRTTREVPDRHGRGPRARCGTHASAGPRVNPCSHTTPRR